MRMEISIASFTYNLHTPDQEGREGGVSMEEWGLCRHGVHCAGSSTFSCTWSLWEG